MATLRLLPPKAQPSAFSLHGLNLQGETLLDAYGLRLMGVPSSVRAGGSNVP